MTEQKEKKLEDIKKEAEQYKCLVQKSCYFIAEFLSGPMCGKCFPCSLGSYEARIRLKNIIKGRGTEADLLAIKRIATEMLDSSMCKKGKDTAVYMSESIELSPYIEHISGVCRDKECLSLIKYIIIPEQCIICGDCQDVCKDNAIIGEKKKSYLSSYLPFEIVQKRCTKCGECIKVCPYGAIEIVDIKAKVDAEVEKKQVKVEV
ncbi:MAG: 4Fe-4S dicluster domain-containing protein [Nitrospirae bacterium]|nr:4Fe-4S dicluster domain-containing protein [Nitrospirota bacterium]